jgi:arginine decarboxylase
MGQNKVGDRMNLPNYLKYKDNVLYLNDINLLDLIKNEGDILEITDLDIISNQIKYLKKIFNDKINHYNYAGKYEYFYATKANYRKEIMEEVLENTPYLETSTKNDISIIEYLYNHQKLNNNSKIICNGFKNKEYFDKIFHLKEQGLNIIPIIENEEELKYLVQLNIEMEVGIRLDVDDEYNMVYKVNDASRFGMLYSEVLANMDLIKSSKLKVTIFHFHMNHSIDNIEKYIDVLTLILKRKYIPLKQALNSINYLDMGGGMPVSVYNKIDYELLVDNMIKTIKSNCQNGGIDVPNLINECGSFTVSDSRFNIFKVALKKQINDNSYWYILNSSIVTTIPDAWIVNKKYLVLPINLINNKKVCVRLSGLTCDNADKYFYQEDKNYLELPIFNDNEELYIAFFKTGAYETQLSGFNTIHHCLI